MKSFYIAENDFWILDHDSGVRMKLKRVEAKALARFLLVELHVVRFYLNDGRAGHLMDNEFINLLKIKYGENECLKLLQSTEKP